ncbi:hypothetical protein CYMTET_18531 [Cymbomonas tetramitiformis]|uniref:Uncharacterized protein n=1 Tax=Cymbomonas tetramitiformis TaxID=36881 RepID=A0AAE0G7Z1_9CHLO|nr:hypothetical protein CYMTET_18531 [Cymbomonas tetramitiformis]
MEDSVIPSESDGNPKPDGTSTVPPETTLPENTSSSPVETTGQRDTQSILPAANITEDKPNFTSALEHSSFPSSLPPPVPVETTDNNASLTTTATIDEGNPTVAATNSAPDFPDKPPPSLPVESEATAAAEQISSADHPASAVGALSSPTADGRERMPSIPTEGLQAGAQNSNTDEQLASSTTTTQGASGEVSKGEASEMPSTSGASAQPADSGDAIEQSLNQDSLKHSPNSNPQRASASTDPSRPVESAIEAPTVGKAPQPAKPRTPIFKRIAKQVAAAKEAVAKQEVDTISPAPLSEAAVVVPAATAEPAVSSPTLPPPGEVHASAKDASEAGPEVAPVAAPEIAPSPSNPAVEAERKETEASESVTGSEREGAQVTEDPVEIYVDEDAAAASEGAPGDAAPANVPGDAAPANVPGDAAPVVVPDDAAPVGSPGDAAPPHAPGDTVSSGASGNAAPVDTLANFASLLRGHPTADVESPSAPAEGDTTGAEEIAPLPPAKPKLAWGDGQLENVTVDGVTDGVTTVVGGDESDGSDGFDIDVELKHLLKERNARESLVPGVEQMQQVMLNAEDANRYLQLDEQLYTAVRAHSKRTCLHCPHPDSMILNGGLLLLSLPVLVYQLWYMDVQDLFTAALSDQWPFVYIGASVMQGGLGYGAQVAEHHRTAALVAHCSFGLAVGMTAAVYGVLLGLEASAGCSLHQSTTQGCDTCTCALRNACNQEGLESAGCESCEAWSLDVCADPEWLHPVLGVVVSLAFLVPATLSLLIMIAHEQSQSNEVMMEEWFTKHWTVCSKSTFDPSKLDETHKAMTGDFTLAEIVGPKDATRLGIGDIKFDESQNDSGMPGQF